MATTTAAATSIKLARIKREIAEIEITGTAPLIVHRWSEKARQMMLDAQQGRKNPKQPKDPIADFEATEQMLRLQARQGPASLFTERA